ncbi:hypothetical protein HK101_007874 [Irineochytrium annulatum]|nr:hypothetical protein HK101_007874 [Irineochytrium annulatum]
MIIHVCELTGNDAEGSGTEKMPFLTPLRALRSVQGSDEAQIKVRKDHVEGYKDIAGAAMKKAKKGYELEEKKKQKAREADEKTRKDKEAKAVEEQRRLEEAKSVILVQQEGLAKPLKIKIRETAQNRGMRVAISAWVHNVRVQGKDMIFVVLRDGTGLLQCVLRGNMCHTYDALTLTRESTVTIYGVLEVVPQGKSAPGGHELVADFWEVISKAPMGDDAIDSLFNTESSPDHLLNLRHLVIRGDKTSSYLKMRHIALRAFRDFFESRSLVEVTPPLMVQTQVEGGSTLFNFKYYDEEAYLTQSSQLYLETVLPSVGDAYCIAESFRAEKSLTRRHLSQFTHCEAELAFINFDDLLSFIEAMVVGVVDRIFADPIGAAIMAELNPDFKRPTLPFRRMTYSEAIDWLKANGIKKDDGSDYTFGEDIPESPERRMTDSLNEPILLCKFPVEIKSFYMKRCDGDRRLTESVDVLMPGVGEITGGSMRISDLQELMEGYKREGIDPSPYYW